jgi:uncharacterized membrane protein YvlD (DUF360 family)
MHLLVWFLIRFVVFGIAITFAMKKIKEVKVEPKHAIPVVALVFALLNATLYLLLSWVFNLFTLWSLFFLVPFVVNGLLLYATDRLVKYFEIKGVIPFLKTVGIMTAAHLLVWIAERIAG